MKVNDSAPPQMSVKARFEEITKIMAKGFRRLRGDWDDAEELPSGLTGGSDGIAESRNEE